MSTKNIDEIIEKIGFGKYQYIVYIVLALYFVCDGAEVMALSFLNLILQNEWSLSDDQISLIGTGLFAGFFVGSMVSGNISDRYGRRKLYIHGVTFVFITGILTALCTSFNSFFILKTLYGFGIGVLQPLTSAILIEITPIHFRGRALIIVSSLFTLGELLACLIAYLTLPDPSSGNWIPLVIWVTVPVLASIIFSIKYLKESPRYEIFRDIEEAIKIMKYMYFVNHKTKLEIDAEERVKLENWSKKQGENFHTKKLNMQELFNKDNKRITICLWIIWFTLSFVYYGIIYISPKTLNSAESSALNFQKIVIAVLGEIPSYFVAYWLIETSLGRKISLVIGFFASGIFCLIPWLTDPSLFVPCMFMAKLWINMSFSVIYPLTCEIYHTLIRTTGVGMSSAASRIGGMLMPWIANYSFNYSPYAPYAIFGLCSIGAGIATLMLPYDTRGRELDKIENVDTKLPEIEMEQHLDNDLVCIK